MTTHIRIDEERKREEGMEEKWEGKSDTMEEGEEIWERWKLQNQSQCDLQSALVTVFLLANVQ